MILNPTHEPLPPTLISSCLHRQALSSPQLIKSHFPSVFPIAPSLLRACTLSPLTVMTAIEEATPGNARKDVSNGQSCQLAARRILPCAPYSPRVQAISAPRLLKPRVPAVSQCFSSPTSTPFLPPQSTSARSPAASRFRVCISNNTALPWPQQQPTLSSPASRVRRTALFALPLTG